MSIVWRKGLTTFWKRPKQSEWAKFIICATFNVTSNIQQFDWLPWFIWHLWNLLKTESNVAPFLIVQGVPKVVHRPEKDIHCYICSNWAPFSVIKRCTLRKKLFWTSRRVSVRMLRHSVVIARLHSSKERGYFVYTTDSRCRIPYGMFKTAFCWEYSIVYYWKWCSIWECEQWMYFHDGARLLGHPIYSTQ